jgi:hypothetical protein
MSSSDPVQAGSEQSPSQPLIFSVPGSSKLGFSIGMSVQPMTGTGNDSIAQTAMATVAVRGMECLLSIFRLLSGVEVLFILPVYQTGGPGTGFNVRTRFASNPVIGSSRFEDNRHLLSAIFLVSLKPSAWNLSM